MKIKRALILFTVVFMTLGVCVACDFNESDNNLQGGVLLDSEYISKIKEEVLATEETTSEQNETETETETETSTQEIGSFETESDSSSRSELSSTYTESEFETYGEEVYWTESGGVWHLYSDCGHLKNSDNVISGSQDDALEAGKRNVCSTCKKKHEKNSSTESGS